MENESYREGYAQGVKDFAERLKLYYTSLAGKTMTLTVAYFIDLVEKEMTENG